MAKLSIVAGATSVSVNLWVQNSSSTTGAGLTAIAPAGGALLTGTKCYYTFAGANAASTSITLTVLATVGTAYTSGGIVTIDDTNLPGVVRLDLPNAVLAAAKGRSVLVMLSGGTNMAPCVLEIELTGWDNQDAVHGGMSALPNAAAGASGGLIINGTNAGTVTLAALTVSGATTLTGNVSMAAGLTITQSTTNGNGISVTGNGTGHGILATSGSGATGDGIRAVAASTNGNGFTGVHTGTGFDLNCTTSPPLQVNATQIGGVAPASATIGTVTNLTNAATAGDLTATMKASVATAVWTDLTTGADFSTTNSIGLLLKTAIPNAAAGAAGGLIINGTNSGTVTLAALTVSGATTLTGNVSMAAGLTITQSTLNGNGISVTGNGTGNGILATSGSGVTGDGIRATAASTNGNGVTGVHTGTGFDLNCTTSPPLQVNATQIGGVVPGSATIGTVTTVTTVSGNVTGRVLGGGATAFTGVGVQSDLEQVGAVALATHAAGMVPADMRDIVGAAVSTTTAQIGANAVQIGGVAAALDANNLLKVDVEDVNGLATLAELLQAAPPALPSLSQAIMLLYMTLRNQLTTTASQKSIYNNAGTLITKKALSDNGTTYTETQMVSGP